MSEYYQHLLIPSTPNFRPEFETVCQFLSDLIEEGRVSDGYSLSYSAVTIGDPIIRVMTNPFTGETHTIKGPSRKLAREVPLEKIKGLLELPETAEEYDVSVGSEGIPTNPPLKIGFDQGTTWIPMESSYHLEIRCRVRSHIVKLSQLRSEEEFDCPLDFSNLPELTFDEDCDAEETEGIFVHPGIGPFRVANAGCGKFWIEFKYGKFAFPRSQNGKVDLLDKSIVDRAQTLFSNDFVQACSWC